MKINQLLCPEPNVLSDFALGRLDDERLDRVAAHLDRCAECLATLQTLDESGDTLLSNLRGTLSAEVVEVPEVCRRAVARAASFLSEAADEATVAGRVMHKLGRIRDYELIEELGRGGMGAVYKALHVNLKRLVALKILPAEKMQDHRAVARFHREMEAVGKLVHPNIVLAHDAGEADGQHFLVMEYVDGLDLAQLADRCRPLAVADACELVRQAALGLQHAHENGLVHRDIKPSNLMLSVNGQTKILDLGLALLDSGQTGNENLTGDCQLMGTIDYIAPEQAGDSHAVDIRADIYSLGCTLYRLLVGRAPFSGPQYSSTLKKLMAHAQTPVTPAHQLRPDLPRELSQILDRMMAKSPAHRFATPRQVSEALSPFTVGSDLTALLGPAGQGSGSAVSPITATGTASGCASALEPTVTKPSDELIGARNMAADEMPMIVVQPSRRKRSGPPTWLVAAVVTFAAVVMLYATITVIVKDKSGKKKRIKLPDDTAEVVVENDGKTEGIVKITPPPAGRSPAPTKQGPPPPDTIDRRVAEHVLALGGTMQLLYRPYGRGVNQIGDLPSDSFKIKGISLPNARLLHSDHIAMIAQLRHLRRLDVADTPIGDADLEQIAKIPTLDWLSLTGTQVTNDGLAALQALEWLRVLHVAGIHIEPSGAAVIGGLPRLEGLDLNGSRVNDEAAAKLSTLRRLRHLTLSEARITDAALQSLSQLSDLELLQLWDARITGTGLKHLAKLPRLDTLKLDRSRIQEQHLHELQAFPALHELHLNGTRLKDSAVDTLSQIKTLTQIDLDDTRVSSEGRRRLGEALPGCNLNLQHQEATRKAAIWVIENGGTVNYVNRSEQLPSAAFEVFQVSFKNLPLDASRSNPLTTFKNPRFITYEATTLGDEYLRQAGALSRLQQFWAFGDGLITDAGAEVLAKSPMLHSLALDAAHLSEAGVASLRILPLVDVTFLITSDEAFKAIPKERLRNLSLALGSNLSDAGLQDLAKSTDLEHFSSGRSPITDDGLECFRNLRRLTSLDLGHAHVFGEGLTHLANLKQLEKLDLSDTRVSGEHLAALSGLDRLCSLNLRNAEVSDAGLDHLKPLTDLDVLYLEGTQVTEAGIAQLQEALPHCTIFSDFHPETP
jgi:serine/threonine protein kinase/Leucine-rich repeat (LRR) protein